MVCAYRNCTSRLIEARCFCLLSALCAPVVPLPAVAFAAALVGFCTDLPLAEVRLGLLLHTIKSFAIVYKDFFFFHSFHIGPDLEKNCPFELFSLHFNSIVLVWFLHKFHTIHTSYSTECYVDFDIYVYCLVKNCQE